MSEENNIDLTTNNQITEQSLTLSKNPRQILTIGFGVMLLLMGVVFVVAYILPNYIIDKQTYYAKLIEVVSEQNLRSERIAKLALNLRLCFKVKPCVELVDDFEKEVKIWREVQSDLKSMNHKDEAINIALNKLYNDTYKFYAPMLKATEKLLNYREKIFQSQKKKRVDIIVRMILVNEAFYSKTMSEISILFAEREKEQFDRLQTVKLTILIVLMVVIIIVVFFIYRFMNWKVSKYLNHIDENRNFMQEKNKELETAYLQLQTHDKATVENALKIEQSNIELKKTQKELELTHKEVSRKNKKLENALKQLREKHRLEDSMFMDISLNKFGEVMHWDQNQTIFSWTEKLLEELTPYVGAIQSIIHGYQEDRGVLSVYAAYGVLPEVYYIQSEIKLGEGIIGQVAKSQKKLEIVTKDGSYFDTYSATDDIKPTYLLIIPLIYNDTIAGVIELAAVKKISVKHQELLDKLSTNIAANLNALTDQKRINQLFADSQLAQKQLKRSFRQIQENEERFRMLAEVTQEGLLFVREHSVIDANTVIAKMLNYKDVGELIKKPYINIIDPKYRFEIEEKNIIEKGVLHETIAITNNGDTFPIELQAREVKYGNDEVTVLSVRDITERKQTEQALEEANKIASLVKVIEKKNKDITSSIEYAKRIQQAILPKARLINNGFPDNFIMYMPKDIVSGDFYWYAERKGHALIAAVDCTGHGVPGAFMSIIGYSQLNKIVIEQGITNPAEILTLLDKGVSEVLNQNEEGSDSRDGMDLSICSFNKKTQTVSFSGAYRPLYFIRNNNLEEYKGDSFPIGGNFKYKKQKVFTNKEIKIQKNDTIYLFSDGFPDQFGGPKNRKYMAKRFKALLLKIQTYEMFKQKKILDNEFLSWKGEVKQMDDIMVIGLRF